MQPIPATMTPIIRRSAWVKNGAMILDVKQGWDPAVKIVLCIWTYDITTDPPIRRSADPYVTWHAHVNDQGEIITLSGHYFDRLIDAVIDFDSRI